MIDPFGAAVLALLLLGFVWGAVANRHLQRATGLRCFGYRLGALLAAVSGTAIVSGVAFAAYRAWGGTWASAGLRANRLAFTLALPFALAVVALGLAGEWQRLFREYEDWRALAWGHERGFRRSLRMLAVALLGRVPAGVVITHAASAAPLSRALTEGVLPLAGPVVIWVWSPINRLPMPRDVRFVRTCMWILVTGIAVGAAFMLCSALVYSHRADTGR